MPFYWPAAIEDFDILMHPAFRRRDQFSQLGDHLQHRRGPFFHSAIHNFEHIGQFRELRGQPTAQIHHATDALQRVGNPWGVNRVVILRSLTVHPHDRVRGAGRGGVGRTLRTQLPESRGDRFHFSSLALRFADRITSCGETEDLMTGTTTTNRWYPDFFNAA